jgi:hypothetical protein
VGKPSMPGAVNVGRRDMADTAIAWHRASMDDSYLLHGVGVA